MDQQSTRHKPAARPHPTPTDTGRAVLGPRHGQLAAQSAALNGAGIIQPMMRSGLSMGPDTGADNVGVFELDDQRREAEAQAQAQRQRLLQVAAARRIISGNMQLSANKPAALAEFDALVRQGGPQSPEALAYQAIQTVLGQISGSDNADREQHGGALGFSRR